MSLNSSRSKSIGGHRKVDRLNVSSDIDGLVLVLNMSKNSFKNTRSYFSQTNQIKVEPLSPAISPNM